VSSPGGGAGASMASSSTPSSSEPFSSGPVGPKGVWLCP
jgi:hypothetical protein